MKKFHTTLLLIIVASCLIFTAGCGSSTSERSTTKAQSGGDTLKSKEDTSTARVMQDDVVIALSDFFEVSDYDTFDEAAVRRCATPAIAEWVVNGLYEKDTAASSLRDDIGYDIDSSLYWEYGIDLDLVNDKEFQSAIEEIANIAFEKAAERELPESSEMISDNIARVTANVSAIDISVLDYNFFDDITGVLSTKLLEAFEGDSVFNVKQLAQKEIARKLVMGEINKYKGRLEDAELIPAGQEAFYLRKVDGKWIVAYIDRSGFHPKGGDDYYPNIGNTYDLEADISNDFSGDGYGYGLYDSYSDNGRGEYALDNNYSADNRETEWNGYPDNDVMDRFYIFINYCDSRYFDRLDLEGFDADMAIIARNAPYAHAGRSFNNDLIRAYFENFYWYNPYIEPDAFEESMLNDYETANKDLVVAYEKEMGYK